MKPYLINEVHQSCITIHKNEPEVVEEQICSDQTLKLLKECLEGVVKEGTAKDLNTPYYQFAGKTGTALVANGRHGYADHIYQSSFAGYFPANHPVYSCIVVIKNKPFAKKFYGAAVAGPVFREVADKLVALSSGKMEMNFAASNVQPNQHDSSAFYYSGSTSSIRKVMAEMKMSYHDSASRSDWGRVYAINRQAVVNTNNVNSKIIPNLKGMGLKDALYLLESMNVRVVAKGKGKVVNQSLVAGLPVQKNEVVTLELE